jgi:hypothetical protein
MVVAATPRPLVASLPLTAACIVVLDRERRAPDGSPWLWTLPALALLWVNVHGSFVVLFVLLGCHGLALLVDALRSRAAVWWQPLLRLGGVGLLSLVTTLVNPFGAEMLLYPFETLRLGVLSEAIHEWRQPLITDPQLWPLFALVAAAIIALVRSGERRRTLDVVLLVVFGGLALTAARHAAIFAIVAFPIVARLLSRREPVGMRAAWAAATPGERRTEAALSFVVVLLTVWVTFPALTAAGNERAIVAWHGDRAIARAAEGDLPGRLWNSYDLGGHAIWLGTPEVLVSIDSRTDLYGDGAVREHLAEWRGERDAPARFADQGIGAVLVERQAPLVGQLERHGWERAEEDEVAVVLLPPAR